MMATLSTLEANDTVFFNKGYKLPSRVRAAKRLAFGYLVRLAPSFR